MVKTAPHSTRVRRLDEVAAARKPILRWDPERESGAPPSEQDRKDAERHALATPVVPSAD
jgi:hypothetical protein